MDWLLDEFKKDQGIDLSQDPMAVQRLKAAAEEAKIGLSSTQETEINLPFITADATGAKHLNVRLSRSKLEQLVEHLVDRAFGPCRQALPCLPTCWSWIARSRTAMPPCSTRRMVFEAAFLVATRYFAGRDCWQGRGAWTPERF